MYRKNFLKLTCAGLALCLLPWLAGADVYGIDKAQLAALDAQVGKAMDAYNASDWKGFYGSGWADQMKALQTQQVFDALYKNGYLKQYGTLKSRKIIDSRSTFSDMNGLIVYDAEFSKKKGTLAVNFFKEGGKYKFQQIQVQP